MTANACGVTVNAGPIEATALGNIAVQLIAKGEVADLAEARKIIKDSFDIKSYQPVDVEAWNEAYDRFKAIIEK